MAKRKRAQRDRRAQILFWVMSLIVALSMAIGFVLPAVMPPPPTIPADEEAFPTPPTLPPSPTVAPTTVPPVPRPPTQTPTSSPTPVSILPTPARLTLLPTASQFLWLPLGLGPAQGKPLITAVCCA